MSEATQPVPLEAVIYADGGCRPSRGIGGFGFHGYTYMNTPQKTGSGCKSAMPTDAGYVKGKTGNLDITLVDYIDGFGALIPEVTNNIAELVAADRALQKVGEFNPSKVLLMLDSQYVMQGMTGWAEGWEKNNWRRPDGQPVPNQAYWQSLLATKRLLEESGAELKLQWVKGHNKGEALGNDLADAHATRGVMLGRNILHGHTSPGEKTPTEHIRHTAAKGYWSATLERNRLISHPKWYFSTTDQSGMKSKDGRYVYYFGDAGDEDDLMGRRSATATYSVLYLKEPDPYLQRIRDATTHLGSGHFQGPMRGHLDKIFHQETMADLNLHGTSTFIRDPSKQRLSTSNDVLLVEEIRPTKLAYRGFDRLNALQQLLEEYLHPLKHSRVRFTDVTTHLYETTASTKKSVTKLKSAIKSTTRTLTFDVEYATPSNTTAHTKLSLSVGLDLPDRNTLSALADPSVKVVAVTWPESDSALRYAVVVETQEDVGIWSGVYANLHLLANPQPNAKDG